MENLFKLLEKYKIKHFENNEFDFISEFCFSEKGIDPALIFDIIECFEMRNYFIEKVALYILEAERELNNPHGNIFKVDFYRNQAKKAQEKANNWQYTLNYLYNQQTNKMILCN